MYFQLNKSRNTNGIIMNVDKRIISKEVVMSYWTHINGTITVCPLGRTQAEKRYILETVLNHLPLVTGSERDMDVHIVQKAGHNSSLSCDEYGEHTNNLIDQYGRKSKNGWLRCQDEYIIVIEGNFRDRMMKQTYREFIKWICRLSKRVMVHQCLIRIDADYETSILINEKDEYSNKFYKMFERPSWSQDSDGEPTWCEHLMWESDYDSFTPLLLAYKYYADDERDAEIERREEYKEKRRN